MSTWFHEYPYIDYENLNLDWILKRIKEFVKKFKDLDATLDSYNDELKALQLEFEDLRDFVNQYFDDLDLQDEVNKALRQMLDSEQLAGILSYLKKNVRQFQAQRRWRFQMDWEKSALQSMTTDGTLLWLGGDNTKSNKAFIYTFRVSDGVQVGFKELSKTRYGHLNDMTYYNGKIYMTPGNDPYGSIRICELDTTNFDIIREWNMSELLVPFLRVSGSKVGNVFGIGVGGAENKLVFGEWETSNYRYTNFFSFDPDTGEIKKLGYYIDPISYQTHYNYQKQGIIVKGMDVYACHDEPKSLLKWTIGAEPNNFNVIMTGYGNNFYPYGEIEGGFVLDGMVYFYTPMFLGHSQASKGFIEVFKTNLYGNCIEDVQFPGAVIRNRACYVDTDNINLNPDGSETKPFNTLEEASLMVDYWSRNVQNQMFQIYIKSNSNENDCLVVQNSNIGVKGLNYEVRIPNIVLYNSRVTIENFTCDKDFYGYNSTINVVAGVIPIRFRLTDCIAFLTNTEVADYYLYNSEVTLQRPYNKGIVSYAERSTIKNIPSSFDAPNGITMTASGVDFDLTNILGGYLKTSSFYDDTEFSFYWRPNVTGSFEQRAFFKIGAADLTTIRGGGTVTRYCNILCNVGSGSIASVGFTIKLSATKVNISIYEAFRVAGSTSADLTAGIVFDFRMLTNC